MSSTWDTTGGNSDGDCFKNRQGPINILLDVDGPGCIHRIFTGVTWGFIDVSTYGTKIQVFIDNNSVPFYDMEVTKFFNDHTGPFPYPFVFQKTYPGILFPIPFARHIKIQLVNDRQVNWGNYWQVVYTKYSDDTKVKSLTLPFSIDEQKELDKACKAWVKAESELPVSPSQWTIDEKISINSRKTGEINYSGSGVIKEIRISVLPNTVEILQQTSFRYNGMVILKKVWMSRLDIFLAMQTTRTRNNSARFFLELMIQKFIRGFPCHSEKVLS
jgi:hypothetical protein